ncbi:MAG: hypothetical protein IJD29_09445 [Anaerotignum sp.]|nr:hypothetical protein [Anaerotignum sp.]
MWAGISILEFEKSIYRKFYSNEDIKLIRGADDASLSEIKRLINKAYKIGDYYVAALLEEMYDELLCTPPKDYPPLPPRSELDARFNEMIAKGLILLLEPEKKEVR